MQTSPVARVYAESLLQLAGGSERIDELGAQLEQIATLVDAEPQFRAFLHSPAIPDSEKKRVVEAALRGRADDVLVDFLGVLLDKQRIAELESIASAYRERADVAAGRQRVQVSSAVALADDQRQRLQSLLEERLRRTCILETQVEPDLLGGIVFTIGDKVYDGSVRNQLRRLRKEMMKSSGYED
jgi:F-type H+-transporting ATPase subunit delta